MTPKKLFRDRAAAGHLLATRLRHYGASSPVVLGLPRGGVPVALEVARELGAPLDVCVVRKIGSPARPELGIGAVSEDGVVYVDPAMQRLVHATSADVSAIVTEKRAEVEERVRRYREGRAPVELRGRTVILVDDGVATGGTARAAVQTVRARGAAKVVVAVPVGAAESIDELARVADEVVCPHPQEMLLSVGHWYEDFRPISDEDVVELLRRARSRSERVPLYLDRDVRIPAGDQELAGRLTIPSGARGLVLFAHGSGSGRRSPRNQYVAGELQSSGLATLLFDLLSEEESALEERTERLRFDVDALANRLVDVTDWAHAGVQTGGLDVGYFGASTGAAAALIAATARPLIVSAVVSRGGRPDLAGTALSRVRAPTLLLVGGADRHVLNLNREALFHLTCDKQLVVVPGATHLFPEPGALEQVAGAAARWFVRHLGHHAFVASA